LNSAPGTCSLPAGFHALGYRRQHRFNLTDFAILDFEDFSDYEREWLAKHRAYVDRFVVGRLRHLGNAAILNNS
jgi:hypothetical protein